MIFWRSEDEGKTWSDPVAMTNPEFPGFALQDTFLRTSGGRILLPVRGSLYRKRGIKYPFSGGLVQNQWVSTSAHYTDPQFLASYVCYSDDEGKTWETNKDGPLYLILDDGHHFDICDEPSICEVSPGNLLMVIRTRMGRLFQSWSQDNGETWSVPEPTSLAASIAPGQIRSLPLPGHLLIVWTQASPQEVRQGYIRTRLSSAVSRNGGGVWEFFQNVESIHEKTRVEAGPIRLTRPAEVYRDAGVAAPVIEDPSIELLDERWGRWSYPSVFVWKDRVLISHTYSRYNEKSQRVGINGIPAGEEGAVSSRLKILPLSWLYGGLEPQDNDNLVNPYKPAEP